MFCAAVPAQDRVRWCAARLGSLSVLTFYGLRRAVVGGWLGGVVCKRLTNERAPVLVKSNGTCVGFSKSGSKIETEMCVSIKGDDRLGVKKNFYVMTRLCVAHCFPVFVFLFIIDCYKNRFGAN